MSRYVLAGVVVLAAVLAACSSPSQGAGASGNTSPSEDGAQASLRSAPTPSGSFCQLGNDLVTSSDVRFVTMPDQDRFDAIDAQLEDLLAVAPSSTVEDLEALQAGFAAIGNAYAATGFEPEASFTIAPDVADASARASSSLESYLLRNCDLTGARDAQIAQIQTAFGFDDPDLAECLHRQLGDVANIDSSSLTPELMITEVCGTSILGLLSGDSE